MKRTVHLQQVRMWPEMAVAAPEIHSSALDDESGYEVSCEWCKEVEGFIVDPKKLPCGHVICANCLSSKIEDQTQTECIKCGWVWVEGNIL